MTKSQNEIQLQALNQRYKSALNERTKLFPKYKYYTNSESTAREYAANASKIATIEAELLNFKNSVETNNISLSSGASQINNKITSLENDKKKLQQKLSSLKGRKEGAQAMYIDSKLIYKQYYLGNWLLVLTMLGMGFMYKKNRQAIY